MARLPQAPAVNLSAPQLDFVQTIPRHLAHKRRIENVFVTSMLKVSETEFLCGAYLPQANVYLNKMKLHAGDVTLTLAEIGRQAAIAICHQFLGVDRESAFILNQMGLERMAGFAGIDWDETDALTLRFTLSERSFNEDQSLKAAVGEMHFLVNGALVYRQLLDWSMQHSERFKKLRGISRAKLLRNVSESDQTFPPADAVGIKSNLRVKRSVLDDTLWLVLDGSCFVATLKIDLSNLFFFDHENDHVPGMLLLEGMRQLALDIAARLPQPSERSRQISTISLTFKTFVELDHPVALFAELVAAPAADMPLTLRISVRQLGKIAAESVITLD